MNRWVYDCEHGMEQYKSTKADPQKKWPTEWCKQCTLWEDNKCVGVAQCKRNIAALKPLMNDDLISRAEAIDALRYAQHRFTVADEAGGMGSVKWSENVIYFAAAERVLTELPSAGRQRGEQYKKGFEDAKRAFLVEYARESENMRKRNAQLEVMLNAQKAISADRPRGEWIVHGEPPWYVRECSECGTKWHQWSGDSNPNYCGNCGADMRSE